jgi:hypothetical protein
VRDHVRAGKTRVSLRDLHYQEQNQTWLELLILVGGSLAWLCQQPWWLALAWLRALRCPFQVL